jgi:hypothetical protein
VTIEIRDLTVGRPLLLLLLLLDRAQRAGAGWSEARHSRQPPERTAGRAGQDRRRRRLGQHPHRGQHAAARRAPPAGPQAAHRGVGGAARRVGRAAARPPNAAAGPARLRQVHPPQGRPSRSGRRGVQVCGLRSGSPAPATSAGCAPLPERAHASPLGSRFGQPLSRPRCRCSRARQRACRACASAAACTTTATRRTSFRHGGGTGRLNPPCSRACAFAARLQQKACCDTRAHPLLPPQVERTTALVAQEDCHEPTLTVRDTLAFAELCQVSGRT